MIRVHIHFNEYTDFDLIELFTKYNVSSHVFIDVIDAELNNKSFLYSIPDKLKKEKEKTPRDFLLGISDKMQEEYIKKIKKRGTNQFLKYLLRERMALFVKSYYTGQPVKEDSTVEYRNAPRCVCEKTGKTFRRKNPLEEMEPVVNRHYVYEDGEITEIYKGTDKFSDEIEETIHVEPKIAYSSNETDSTPLIIEKEDAEKINESITEADSLANVISHSSDDGAESINGNQMTENKDISIEKTPEQIKEERNILEQFLNDEISLR